MRDSTRKECIAVGIKPGKLDVFPWKYLGMTDEEFMAEELHFAHGPVVPKKQQRILLGVVRAEEESISERYAEYMRVRKLALKPFNTRRQLRLF